MNRCVKNCFLLFVFLVVHSTTSAQTLKIKQMQQSVKKAGVCFMNQREYEACQKMVLKSLDKLAFKKDTLILVEYFEDFHSNYSLAYIYLSSDSISNPLCINFHINKKYSNGKLKDRVLREHKTNCSGYIIKCIQNNNIEEVLELGKKQRFLPSSTIVMTIAIKDKVKKDYYIVTYKCYSFPEEEFDPRTYGMPEDFLHWIYKYHWHDDIKEKEVKALFLEWIKMGRPKAVNVPKNPTKYTEI